jgi:hypothetical protein
MVIPSSARRTPHSESIPTIVLINDGRVPLMDPPFRFSRGLLPYLCGPAGMLMRRHALENDAWLHRNAEAQAW